MKSMRNHRLFYRGPSMLGTFRPGDWLRIEKIALAQVRKGDVIVFGRPDMGEEDFVVHRVVGMGPEGPVTRGDNNLKNDKTRMTEENLLGRVIHFERGEKIHKVWNGRLGMLRVRALHARFRSISVVRFFLSKPYQSLKRSGIVARIWRPEIEIIHFETQDGPLVKYIHKGRTVASCLTDSNRWWFRRPYDFVIGPKFQS